MTTIQTDRHISPSQISMWKKCARLWAYVYLEGKKSPPAGAMHLGSSFHKAAEAQNIQKIVTRKDLPADELQDRYSDAWKAVPESEIAWEDERPDKVYDDGARLVGLFAVTSAPRLQPVAAERRVEIPTDNAAIVCVIDVIDENGTVWDFKTKGKSPAPDEAHNSDQLTAYTAAHDFAFGHPPSAVALDFFIRPSKTKPTGFHDTQTTVRSAEQVSIWLDDARAVVSQMEHGIETGLFPYAPADSWACSEKFCGAWKFCPGGARRHGA